MARARNIKPGFFQNEMLTEVSFAARLLFIGLWTIADREGRLEDRPRRIKMQLFPADDIDVDAELDALQEQGFIIRYEHDANRYIAILNFGKHQNPHQKEADSTIPAPDLHSANTEPAPDKHGANPKKADTSHADSLNPITDSPLLNVGEDARDESHAAAPADMTSFDLTHDEIYALNKIKKVRGMDAVSEQDIIEHLREIIDARGSPVPGDQFRQEVLKFRDFYNSKRSNQPKDKKWGHWKSALTNWIGKIDERTQKNGRAYAHSGSQAGLYGTGHDDAEHGSYVRERIDDE